MTSFWQLWKKPDNTKPPTLLYRLFLARQEAGLSQKTSNVPSSHESGKPPKTTIRDPRIMRHPGLQPIWDSMERERYQQQIAAVVLMLVSLAVIAFGVVTRSLFIPLVGGVLATGGLYWLYYLLSEQPLAQLRRQLHDTPEDFVWVYTTQTERMPFGFKTQSVGTLYLVEKDGSIESVSLKPMHLLLVTKTLNRVLPNAEFGYTPERELQYRGEITEFRGRREQDIFF